MSPINFKGKKFYTAKEWAKKMADEPEEEAVVEEETPAEEAGEAPAEEAEASVDEGKVEIS